MNDIYSIRKRSEIMSHISGKDTKPEAIVRKYLFSQGFRYKKHVSNLPGNPDLVLPKYKTVIFVHGCFWHGHTCLRGKSPETNRDFWTKKINRNKQRDLENIDKLKTVGWHPITIWQCEISGKRKERQKMSEVCQKIRSYNVSLIKVTS
ncbi:MAG: Very short patch repair protein [Verrucomicrobia subdivision 3 bacterium]|nr:Very short patch repair protein [Limisphaerales bacterium]MCS1413425.1 Very short patch repair protein [Limisphaerales bacterium]